MKRAIPVLIAVVLILIIGGVGVGRELMEKYSYSTERADLDEYFNVSAGQLAIVLQDEIMEEKALLREGACYFDLDTAERFLQDEFYVDSAEGLLLYTNATQIFTVSIGGNVLCTAGSVMDAAKNAKGELGGIDLGYTAAFEEDGTLYVAADYVRRFANYSVELFDRHVQVYTEWGDRKVDSLKKDSALRLSGGIKSPILCDLTAGDEVEVLDGADGWSRVKTSDSLIGYVEDKVLALASEGQEEVRHEIPVTDYVEPEYTSVSMEGKVCLGWHYIGSADGNGNLESMAAAAEGMNVIAPTWYSLNDEEGGFRSLASKDYVDRAHTMGLQVWGVWDDFNYKMENSAEISVQNVLASTPARQRLVGNMVSEALSLSLDGINLDFEEISGESEPHYAQFVRELSLECRKNGLILSIDDKVPFSFNSYQRLDVQGKAADYVIIMGYDEHYHGSGNPGSVASIDYVSGGITRALESVPAEKLVNALPFYTYLWKTEGSKVTDETLTLKRTQDYLKEKQLAPQWDQETCQNYVEWTTDGTFYQLWIEDEASIMAKLGVMSAQEIGGVAVWRLGFGNEGAWNLIQGYLGQPAE